MNQDDRNFYETMKARNEYFSDQAKMTREIDIRAADIIRDENPAPRAKPARLEFNTPEEAAPQVEPGAEPDDVTMIFSIDPQSVNVDRSGTGREIIFGKDPQGNQITLGYLAENPQMVAPKGPPSAGLKDNPQENVQPPAPLTVPGVVSSAGELASGLSKGLALGLSEAGGVVAEAAGVSEEMEEFGAFIEETFGIPRTIPVNISGGSEEVGAAFGRFGSIFVPASRAAKMLGAGLFVRGIVAGGITDFAGFSAEEPNLGDIAAQFKDVNPEIATGIRELLIDTLAKDFGDDGALLDGEFESRLKNSFGGLIAGAAIDSTVFMYRMVRRVMAQPNNIKNMITRGISGERRLGALADSRVSGTGGLEPQEIARQEIEAMNDITIGQVGMMADEMAEELLTLEAAK